MRIRDKEKVSGNFHLSVWKGGKLVEESGDHNMIVDGARVEMAHLASGDVEDRHIAAIALGTNGAEADTEDTEITEPFVKAVESVEYPAPGQVRFNWLITDGEANGMAIMEFGLLCADGTLYARYVREKPLNKENDFLLEGDWTIEF
jgi:hypothetical protein